MTAYTYNQRNLLTEAYHRSGPTIDGPRTEYDYDGAVLVHWLGLRSIFLLTALIAARLLPRAIRQESPSASPAD